MLNSLPPIFDSNASTPPMDLRQTALDMLPTAVSIFEMTKPMTFQVIMVNRAFYAQYGVTEAEVLGKYLHDMLPPEGATKLGGYYQRCIDTGQTMSVEDSYAVENDAVMWASSRFAPILNPDGPTTRLLVTWEDITERKKREQLERAQQLAIIEEQAARLTELSTPLLTVSDTTVVMPLIGAIDQQRVQHMMETLLTGVNHHGAETVILDITGVPVVDTYVANALVRAAQAVRLLGAKVVLVGIRPEVAQSLVSLGVDLSSIITRASLRDGIAYALR